MRSAARVSSVRIDSDREKSITTLTISVLFVTLFVATSVISRPGAAFATTVSIVGTPAYSREADAGTIPFSGNGTRFNRAQVGTGGDHPQAGQAGILFFELPDLFALPEITDAELTVELTDARDDHVFGQVPSSFNVDLYFLGVRDALAMEVADYSDAALLPTAATLIQDNWWVANDDSQIGTSKSIAVGDVIRSAYTDGTPNDVFAVFALYGDMDFTGNQFTTFLFEYQGPKPDLSITSVPEPSTFTLCAFGVVGIALWQRRTVSRLR